ncbi:DUF932 domain-containing protein [Steroidobacter agaridevorans]|uniref:DUF932 domain-containing protein n=1 Tax=Steroidobacter agaridevorans TaxID=2695856 RepID=UPI001323AE3D|nr:DUF932 domain-containing protein [Steroidobacter agaridevorans]GFE87799.1 hypothetical protein GCM10011488_27530 [Steroidobacter agaridevorans]
MDTIQTLLGDVQIDSAFNDGLDRAQLERLTPAAYTTAPHAKLSTRYAFLPTSSVIETMSTAGFNVVQAAQSRSRKQQPEFACHALRFRKAKSAVFIGEVVPEILILNSHDGTSAYQVRIALFRAICGNGMIVSDTAFPCWRVPHRGSAPMEVLEAALRLSDHFGEVSAVIDRMRHFPLDEEQRLEFASDALAIRYPDEPVGHAVSPAELLVARRPEDEGTDLWHTLNVVQEYLLRGGARRITATKRQVRMRGIGAIREGVRLNTALWERAMVELA